MNCFLGGVHSHNNKKSAKIKRFGRKTTKKEGKMLTAATDSPPTATNGGNGILRNFTEFYAIPEGAWKRRRGERLRILRSLRFNPFQSVSIRYPAETEIKKRRSKRKSAKGKPRLKNIIPVPYCSRSSIFSKCQTSDQQNRAKSIQCHNKAIPEKTECSDDRTHNGYI